MGQSACRDGLVECKEFTVWPSDRGREGVAEDGQRGSVLPQPEPPPPDAEWLLAGLPRELAEALRYTGQWPSLRRRPWLSAAALRSFQRSLQQCQLRQLAERYREAEAPDECSYDIPMLVRWTELDADHVICAGQVMRLPDVPREKLSQLRRQGFTALKQNKVGVALLAGGANLRLGSVEAPVGCIRKGLKLRSGKSIIQLMCERVRRIADMCRTATELPGKAKDPFGKAADKKARVSVPVFVMTSRLTHRMVVEHFESSNYFGLPSRDVFFFEQPVWPVLDEAGQLLPQSLGGDFAHLPGGTGQVLQALVGSLGLERMRDRGVECLHILGTDNVLAKVCDPVFIGFCRDLDIDCACKVVERMDVAEDLELFCVRQSPVSSAYADIEEAACGLDPSAAPFEMLSRRGNAGEFAFCGSINSVFMTVSYIEEVVDRRLKAHLLMRPVPFLDFHPEVMDEHSSSGAVSPRGGSSSPRSGGAVGQLSDGAAVLGCTSPSGKGRPVGGVAPGCWPAESLSPDLACQRALAAAAAEVCAMRRSGCRASVGEDSAQQLEDDDPEAAWRCDVHLDCGGPVAVVRVRSARPGPPALKRSLAGPRGSREAAAAAAAAAGGTPLDAVSAAAAASEWLRCSLVVPGRPNAWTLETSILDYFAFTDRAVALQVARPSEFASVRAVTGLHTAEDARRSLHSLHCTWLMRAGVSIHDIKGDPDGLIEVSPLVSYEGEGLEQWLASSRLLEVENTPEESCNVGDEAVEGGLDTRQFYLQEYPLRPEVSCSHAPRFLAGASDPDSPGEAGQDAETESPIGDGDVEINSPSCGARPPHTPSLGC